jgi:hypothetical protein
MHVLFSFREPMRSHRSGHNIGGCVPISGLHLAIAREVCPVLAATSTR